MKIRDLVRVLDAEVLCGEDFLDRETKEFCACDILSDVLGHSKEDCVILTGLTSLQVIRTAELTGAIAIIYVRSKFPPPDAIGLANSLHIPLLRANKLMFESCKVIVEELIKERENEQQIF